MEPGAVDRVDIRGKGLFSGEEKIFIFLKEAELWSVYLE